VALVSTLLAAPLVLVELGAGADAPPDARPAAYVVDLDDAAASDAAVDATDALPRAVGTLSGEELANQRLVATFSDGAALRAAAEAERIEADAAEAEEAAEAEAEREAAEAERAEVELAAAEAAEAERAARLEAEQAEAERQARLESQRRAEAEAAAAAPAPTSSGGPTPQQWHNLRMCESSNNYQAVSPNGLYYGAYQFGQPTWDETARAAGRGDLVGMRPSQASPADQDAMAVALYQRRGSSPWPSCGAHLR
jgi:hypothetical protein